jgi:cobalt-zinc-cadmium efflux system protein
MGHDHASSGRHHLRPLLIAFAMVATFMVVEAVAGWLTGSLALISDAGAAISHLATGEPLGRIVLTP